MVAIVFSPSLTRAILQEILRSRAPHIIHPDVASALAKSVWFDYFSACHSQLLACNLGAQLVFMETIITDSPPLATIIDLKSSTQTCGINTSQAKADFLGSAKALVVWSAIAQIETIFVKLQLVVFVVTVRWIVKHTVLIVNLRCCISETSIISCMATLSLSKDWSCTRWTCDFDKV